MAAIRDFLQQARRDEPVFINLVRDAFQREGTHRVVCRFTLYDGGARDFELRFPALLSLEERGFAASYLHAALYNILSVLGARQAEIFVEEGREDLLALARGLNAAFQVDLPLPERKGYGKCLNVNQRTLAALYGPEERFRFLVRPLAEHRELPAEKQAPAKAESGFGSILRAAGGRMLMGMDIGGTDIKIAVSVDNRLCLFKEFDWFPAAFEWAAQLIDPILLLTRLMRAGASLYLLGRADEIISPAFLKTASLREVAAAADAMEALAGDGLRGFDAIGLCFPDVVIRNRIVGGETYKTRGMRENSIADYEREFARITDLHELLAEYVRPGGAVMNTNDGPMAAFTTAMEEAAAGLDLSSGFFAHTLGTELGTGWILPDGSIPEIPLEAYNFIIDLGSFGQTAYEVDDIRSVLNFNTGLAGTLQKYASQSGVFRLAAKHLPQQDPEVYKLAFEKGYFKQEGGKLSVPTAPKDLRKPCLEFFMKQAEVEGSAAEEIFREVGVYLAVTWLETEYILKPACKARTLYGRLVKSQACFELMKEGARRLVPGISLFAADDSLVKTPLMKQLQQSREYTVAQFAQAVGAVYYGCAGLI